MKSFGDNTNLRIQRFKQQHEVQLNPHMVDNFTQVYQDSKASLKHNKEAMTKVLSKVCDKGILNTAVNQLSK